MSELKPCPFCGGKAETYCNIGGFWGVDCDSNACFTHTMLADYVTEEEAIEAWNTRADAEIRAKAIDEFAEKIKEHMQIVGTTYLEDIFEIAEQMKGGASDGIN